MRLRPPALLVAGLLSLPALAGCDAIEGFLSQPTTEERRATAAILEDETGCASVEVVLAPASGAGGDALTTDDCRLQGADTYADFWLLKATAATDVEVEMTGAGFSPYLGLFPVDLADGSALDNTGIVDDNADGDTRALVAGRVSAGLYVVLASSVAGNQTGGYTLRVARGD